MKVEKTINICGMDVRMRYCAAAETGYETLSGKSSAVFAPIEVKDENGNPTGWEVKAVFDDYIRLAVAAVIAAYSSSDAKPPISVDDVLFEATPQDVSALVEAVIELRKEWYQVPAVVQPEGEENKDEKNA
jgi:hypothetical protein